MYVIRGSIGGWKLTTNEGSGEVERRFETEEEVLRHYRIMEHILPEDATTYYLNDKGELELVI